MKSRLFPSFLVAFLFASALLAFSRADETPKTIKFSDPAKPGTVRINLGRGDLRVQGGDTAEVSVVSNMNLATEKPRKDGLRVISSSAGFSMTEKDNVVTIDTSHELGRTSANLKLTVPRNTTVVVENAWNGDVTCAALSGDIEINSMRGAIHLDDVAGGVVASTMSGEIEANIRELRDGRPLSFTSMNGEVVIRVPESAKANIRLRTQNGSVLTDFEETALVTKAEGSGGIRGKSAFVYKGMPNGKVISVEIEDALREATRISATATKQALEAVKQGFEAAQIDTEDARRQLEDAKKEMERARREADRARRQADEKRNRGNDTAVDDVAPAAPTPPAIARSARPAVAPRAPVPPRVPTITGGKLVTGTLNGGGPEISVSTMNGDVVLRKLGGKQ